MTIDLKAIRAAAEADKGQDRAFILLSVDILALLDRLEAAEKDAERYRFLFLGSKVYARFREVYNYWDGLDGKVGFDAAIDAAMKDEQK